MQIQRVNDLPLPLAEQVHRLQLAAYAVEARLIGNDGIRALHETVNEMLGQGLRWLLATDDDTLVGAAGYRIVGGASIDWISPDAGNPHPADVEVLDIDRLVIDPSMFRRGIGRAMVSRLLDEAGSRWVVVSTGRDNLPARQLYVRSGFDLIDQVEVIPGLFIVRYRHR